MKDRCLGATAAFSAGLAVILGALAAHALADRLEASGHTDSFDTAVLYHLTHSIGALVLAHAGFRRPAWWMLAGVLLFSGSIYVLCLTTGFRWLGPVTPVGGLLMIGAWFAVGISYLRGKE
jgi:uncharacterized membrane protein YgdD (TMEM256/DUF423 family)